MVATARPRRASFRQATRGALRERTPPSSAHCCLGALGCAPVQFSSPRWTVDHTSVASSSTLSGTSLPVLSLANGRSRWRRACSIRARAVEDSLMPKGGAAVGRVGRWAGKGIMPDVTGARRLANHGPRPGSPRVVCGRPCSARAAGPASARDPSRCRTARTRRRMGRAGQGPGGARGLLV